MNELASLKSSLLESNKEDELNISNKIININNDITIEKGNMDNIINTLRSELDKEKDAIDFRTKRNLFYAMLQKYQRVIQKFSDEESNMKKIKVTKLIREAEIGIGGDLTSEEKKQVMENPKIIEQIYKNRLSDKAHPILANFVRDLEDRHEDIKKLEKSIIELNKMIIELSKLVQYQGEMINNIAKNVSISNDYIKRGEREITEGKNCLECKRKIKCTITIIVSVILLIIIIPLIVKLV